MGILRQRNPFFAHAFRVAKHVVDTSVWERIKAEMVKPPHNIENANQLSLRCGGEPSTATISRWENGLDMPSRKSVVKIAGILGVSVSRFLDPENDDPDMRTILDAMQDPDAKSEMAAAARRVASLRSRLRGESVEPPDADELDHGPRRER